LYCCHPLYTRFTNIFGASISEATMRPDPRLAFLVAENFEVRTISVAAQRIAKQNQPDQISERIAPPPPR
jgi:hypothetical protein